MNRIEELRKLAEEASPGEWFLGRKTKNKQYISTTGGRSVEAWWDEFCSVYVTVSGEVDKEGVANANFIAAANPQTILALLDLVELQHEVLGLCTFPVDPVCKARESYNKFKEQS